MAEDTARDAATVDFFDLPTTTPTENIDSETGEEIEAEEETGEVTEEETEEEEVEESSEEEEGEEEEAPKEEEKIKKKARNVTFTRNGEEAQIKADSKLTVTENGKQIEVTLEDLITRHVSHNENNRLYKEVLSQREQVKQLQADVKKAEGALEGRMQQFAKEVETDGDLFKAFRRLFKDIGIDPIKPVRDMRNLLHRHANELAGLTEEQIKYLDDLEELEYLREQQAEVDKVRNTKSQEETAKAEVERVIKDYGLPDAQMFIGSYQRLKELFESTQMDSGAIHPEGVGKFYRDTVRLINVIGKVLPNRANDRAMILALQEVQFKATVTNGESPSDEELEEAIRYYVSSSSEKEAPASTPKKKKVLSFMPKQPAKSNGTKAKNKKDPGLNWDSV